MIVCRNQANTTCFVGERKATLQKKLNIEWFRKEYNHILDYLEDKDDQTKKKTLSSLFILTGFLEYQTVMNTIMKKVNDDYKNQKMIEKIDNWISVDKIK